MILPVTVPVSDKTHYDAIARQLSVCLDTAPDGRDRPQMKNGRDDDRLAAVLVPLIWRDSDWQILMTKRAAHLSHHAGQISFPGGALDASDKGLIDTALREAHEEISLAPPSVRLWVACCQCEARLDLSCSQSLVLLEVIFLMSYGLIQLKLTVFLPCRWRISASLIIFPWCRAKPTGLIIVIGWSRILNIISGDYRRGC